MTDGRPLSRLRRSIGLPPGCSFESSGLPITVPLVEELAFRAYLTRRLMGPDVERLPLGVFTWSSFAISSVLFGLLHGTFWVAGTVAGMSFATGALSAPRAGRRRRGPRDDERSPRDVRPGHGPVVAVVLTLLQSAKTKVSSRPTLIAQARSIAEPFVVELALCSQRLSSHSRREV